MAKSIIKNVSGFNLTLTEPYGGAILGPGGSRVVDEDSETVIARLGGAATVAEASIDVIDTSDGDTADLSVTGAIQKPRETYVWQPGGTDGENRYALLTDLVNALQNVSGKKTLCIDPRLAPTSGNFRLVGSAFGNFPDADSTFDMTDVTITALQPDTFAFIWFLGGAGINTVFTGLPRWDFISGANIVGQNATVPVMGQIGQLAQSSHVPEVILSGGSYSGTNGGQPIWQVDSLNTARFLMKRVTLNDSCLELGDFSTVVLSMSGEGGRLRNDAIVSTFATSNIQYNHFGGEVIAWTEQDNFSGNVAYFKRHQNLEYFHSSSGIGHDDGFAGFRICRLYADGATFKQAFQEVDTSRAAVKTGNVFSFIGYNLTSVDATGPWDFDVEIDSSGSPDTVTFTAGAAPPLSTTGLADSPGQLSGLTLELIVNIKTGPIVPRNDRVTITFDGTETTAALVAAKINAGLPAGARVTASDAAGEVVLTPDVLGTRGFLEVTGGTAAGTAPLLDFGALPAQSQGTGNVGSAENLLGSELSAEVSSVLAGSATAKQNNGDSFNCAAGVPGNTIIFSRTQLVGEVAISAGPTNDISALLGIAAAAAGPGGQPITVTLPLVEEQSGQKVTIKDSGGKSGTACAVAAVETYNFPGPTDTLDVAIDGGAVQNIDFVAADFAAPATATAAEVVTVLNTGGTGGAPNALVGATASVVNGDQVVICSDTDGPTASVDIQASGAATILGLTVQVNTPNTITVQGDGGELIDDAATSVLSKNYGARGFVSSLSYWGAEIGA